jgi:hypothetical protein
MTLPRVEPNIFLTQGEEANHYTSDVVFTANWDLFQDACIHVYHKFYYFDDDVFTIF